MSRRNKDEIPAAPNSVIEEYAEEIGSDVIQAFDAWIRPELAKIIGWPAVEKIKDQDFESVLAAQYKMLHIERSHTIKGQGATFYFMLWQGIPGKSVLLSKFKYEIDFTKYNHE